MGTGAVQVLHLVRNIPLNCQLVVRDCSANRINFPQQPCLVGWFDLHPVSRMDALVNDVIGGRQRHLKFRTCGERSFGPAARKDGEDLNCGPRVAEVAELQFLRVGICLRRYQDRAREAPFASLLRQSSRLPAGSQLKASVVAEHIRLPLNPVEAATRLTVGNAPDPLPKRLPDRTKHGFRVRERDAADEKNLGNLLLMYLHGSEEFCGSALGCPQFFSPAPKLQPGRALPERRHHQAVSHGPRYPWNGLGSSGSC